MASQEFILGEFPRTFDDRYRLAIPQELLTALGPESGEFILAKEQPGCLSLWNAEVWGRRLDEALELVKGKMRAGKLVGQVERVQSLGRLLSTRERRVKLAGRGRLLVPEGFREFLRAEPGSEVLVIGAAVCLEIWHPATWFTYVEQRIPRFRRLLDRLSD